MIPSVFVWLDALPLSPNGKISRQALPAPDSSRPDLGTSFVAPQTLLEEALAQIWADLLRLERVGIHDNFFALGGHSLLATQVVSRVRDHCHIELPLRSLFEAQTIASLAAYIDTTFHAEHGRQTLSLQPVSRHGPMPLSFAQERLWFLDQFAPGSPVYHMSSAFHLHGPLDTIALAHSVNEMVRRHEVVRTTFAVVDEQPAQVIAPCQTVHVPVVDLRGLPEADRYSAMQQRAAAEAQRPFDLSRDLMLRVTLLRLGDEDYVLLLVMHHIASDGWSMDILLRELASLYSAFSQGQPSPLPDLPIQYADFAVWQRQWLQGEVLGNQLSYWRQQLSGAAAVLELPTDYPRPAVQTHRGAMQVAVLPTTLVAALETLGQEAGATLFMTLLAAFKVLLHRLTGQEELVVGAPIAGRNRFEVERLLGFFLNTLVLRTTLSGHPSFRTLLGRVREVTLGAYNHQDVPFEKLLEELQVPRDLSRTPLFQVFFNMFNFEDTQLELSGVTVEPLRLFEPLSKFDLTLYVSKRQGQHLLRLVYNADLFCPERMAGPARPIPASPLASGRTSR